MQALYQKEMTGSSNTELIKQFKQNYKDLNLKNFETYLKEIKKNILDIDSTIDKYNYQRSNKTCKKIWTGFKPQIYQCSFR